MIRAAHVANCRKNERLELEDLIIGVLEQTGVAMMALKRLNVRPISLIIKLLDGVGIKREDIKKSIVARISDCFWPPNVSVESERFSLEVTDLLANAKAEAMELSHDYIGTEHALLAVLKVARMAAIFEPEGISYSAARQAVRKYLGMPDNITDRSANGNNG